MKSVFIRYIILFILFVIVCAISLGCGSVWISPAQLYESGILSMRATRLAAGIIVGAGLAASGAIFQSILRNPLADPYILGVSSGASLGATGAMVFKLGLWGVWIIPLGAFVGALLSILIVYGLAREKNGVVHVYSLLLIGVMFNAIAGALLMFVFTIAPADRLPGILWQLMGSLQMYNVHLLWISGVLISLGLIAAWILAPVLNPMLLGDQKAQSLGIDSNRVRAVVFVLASLIAGACVSLCGMIGFVGLIVPHLGRLIFGTDYRRLIPGCIIIGAMLLPTADVIGRIILSGVIDNELPVGVITALMGGPMFIILLIHRRYTSAG